MIDDVRKYLAQFEKATKEIITTEEKLYDHEAKTEKTIENIKKESQQFTMPILAELIKKKKERQAYEDKLKHLPKVGAIVKTEEGEGVVDNVETIINEEKVNVKDTIPLVEADSRLGWEPSMLYMTNKKNLEWKLRQLDYV